MTPAATSVAGTTPLPGRGERVVLDGLPGGPWMTVVEQELDGVVSLSPPRLGGRPVRLPLRREFTIAWTHREVPCEVDALMVNGPAGAAEGTYEARTTGPPRRIQRRAAVRVPVNVIVHARFGDDVDGEVVGAVTENLSASGALTRMRDPVPVGSDIQVAIHCGGDTGDLAMSARAVRCDRIEEGERPWRLAVTFTDLTTAQEDRLVKFLFERQRELRGREAGLR